MLSLSQLMKSANEAETVTHWFSNSLFTLALRSPKLYLSGNTDDGSEFHSLVVRIMKYKANCFVRTSGTLNLKMFPRLEVLW